MVPQYPVVLKVRRAPPALMVRMDPTPLMIRTDPKGQGGPTDLLDRTVLLVQKDLLDQPLPQAQWLLLVLMVQQRTVYPYIAKNHCPHPRLRNGRLHNPMEADCFPGHS